MSDHIAFLVLADDLVCVETMIVLLFVLVTVAMLDDHAQLVLCLDLKASLDFLLLNYQFLEHEAVGIAAPAHALKEIGSCMG